MKKWPRVTTRWLYSVFGVIVLILVGFEITVGAVVFSYYNTSVENLLASRAENLASFYSQYISSEYASLESSANAFGADFAEKDTMELQIINPQGECVYTSLGYAVGSKPLESRDFLQAYHAGISSFYRGEDTVTGERIMAVCTPLKGSDGTTLGVLRLVTSMEGVMSHAWVIVLSLLAICLGIILFVFVTNYYFIGTIVTPLKTISETANKIAAGDMTARIENNYNDEVGELCSSINNMASEIAENERLQNEFISSVSHELRTPMTAIKGWSETMLMCDPKEDTQTINRGLKVVNKEVERLSRMVEELLDFSRIQGGRMKLHTEALDLGERIYSIVTIMRERAHSGGIKINFELPENIIPVNADPDRLNQVFINIIDNAVKHSFEGTEIEIDIITNKEKATVTVKDRGEGISEEDLPHIKNKFYKGENSKQGTGLGLAIADEIINLHGGNLTLQSKKGEGTTVIVELPLDLKG